jgi:hypothetical protein
MPAGIADALNQTFPLAHEQSSLIISGEPPTRAELNAARRAAHSFAALAISMCLGSDADDNSGDCSCLVLTRPNVIMNDVRLRGLAVARSGAAGRKSLHNHAQITRNLRRSLRNAAVAARLIHAEGLDSKLAADGQRIGMCPLLFIGHLLRRGLLMDAGRLTPSRPGITPGSS